MNHRRPAFDATDDADLPVDDWTLDEFDAIDEPSDFGGLCPAFAAGDDGDA